MAFAPVAQSPPTGTALAPNPPLLFSPLKIRGANFQNRVWVSPMCMYSANDGHLSDFHFTHLTSFALRGASLTIIEATGVLPEGRISPNCVGLWNDSQAEGIKKVADFVHQAGQKLGIQLAHAGRKASTLPGWKLAKGVGSAVAGTADGGWPEKVRGPGDTPWAAEGYATPKAMSVQDIQEVVSAFATAAKRAIHAGVDVIEIHGAHGYLISSFLSPTTNTRTDEYGGSLENRMRLALEVTKAVRAAIPDTVPLIFRVSATEWLPSTESQWDVESTVKLAAKLAELGVDIITPSSGGNSSRQKIPYDANYQLDLARAIRAALRDSGCSVLIAPVGRIKEPKQALEALEPPAGVATAGDVVLIGRQFLREPSWVLRAGHELEVKIQWPHQYARAPYESKVKL